MIRNDIPDLLDAEIETERGMMTWTALIAYKLGPFMRIDHVRDIAEIPSGADKCDSVFEQHQDVFLAYAYELVVDIYADLQKLYISQIQDDEFLLRGKFFFVEDNRLILYIKTEFQ